ncbi:MAG: UDP-2,3-diacylglucosamine diphosphatase [Bacteroidales bacterium]|nr:UDP-2,3-diacylglucosamine diphosphatase [Bacteroidales bacterium]
MRAQKKIYFISDVHLGLYPEEKSRQREKLLVTWIDSVKDTMEELYLMGDIFDFWHEYKHVIPKGFTRFLGRLAELSDRGVRISFFSGNHDTWAYSYFREELGIRIYHKPIEKEIYGKKFLLAHGDGLGPGDKSYKILKWIFRNRPLQYLFARLHPNFALWLGKTWSKSSRYAKGIVAEEFLGEDKEFQFLYAKDKLREGHIDYFIFGHRHIPVDIEIAENTRVINLGDWIYSFTYGVFDGEEFALKPFQGNGENIILKRL